MSYDVLHPIQFRHGHGFMFYFTRAVGKEIDEALQGAVIDFEDRVSSQALQEVRKDFAHLFRFSGQLGGGGSVAVSQRWIWERCWGWRA